MKYNVLTYLIGEGVSNVFKNKKQAFIAIGTMFLTMIIFGFSYIIGENFEHLINELELQQGIQIFMSTDPKPTQKEIDNLKDELQRIEYVNTITFVSNKEAVQSMRDKMGEDIMEGFDEEIMPYSYIITLTDISASKQVISEIEKIPNVEVKNRAEVVDDLLKVSKGLKIARYVIIGCLIIFEIFIINNTIKLTVFARRKEISIMKYVGATNGFIRWPFAVEGMIIGLISGLISIIVLGVCYTLIYNMDSLSLFLNNKRLSLLHFSDMITVIIGVYLILGIGLGILGSTISMRKYLKV